MTFIWLASDVLDCFFVGARFADLDLADSGVEEIGVLCLPFNRTDTQMVSNDFWYLDALYSLRIIVFAFEFTVGLLVRRELGNDFGEVPDLYVAQFVSEIEVTSQRLRVSFLIVVGVKEERTFVKALDVFMAVRKYGV